jgi:hypothetical protein
MTSVSTWGLLAGLFPKQFDNRRSGHWLAIWMLAAIVLVELAMGANSTFNTRQVASSADGIPLDRYGGGGAQAVLSLFALTGLFRMLLALQGVLVLIRYRAMVPLMYLQLLLLQLGGMVLVRLNPVVRSGVATAHTGADLLHAILAMTVVGFVLSLLNRPAAADRKEPPSGL